MAYTDRQKAATAAVEAAIVEANDAWTEGDPDAMVGVVTDWVVIAAVQRPDMEDQSNDVTAYTTMMPGGGIPWYRAIGLIHAGLHYMNSEGLEAE